MNAGEIRRILTGLAPEEYAMDWDNSGFLLGREEKEVKKVLITVDVDDETVETAVKQSVDLIISHHPLLFSAVKRITDGDFIGKRILTLLGKDIAYYAMHTNYDVCRMGLLAADRLELTGALPLEVTGEKDGRAVGIGCIGTLSTEVSVTEFAQRVRKRFGLCGLRCFGGEKKIQKVAVCPGAGSSVIPEALKKGADVLVTGDIGHHTGIDAAAQGLSIIDAGHYGLEYLFIEDVKELLEEQFKGEVCLLSMPKKIPFSIV